MDFRLFVAFTPPEEVAEHLRAAVAPLQSRHSELRWTPASMWHLTLAFFGDVAHGRVDALQARLSRAAGRHGGVPLRFRGAGAFSRPARATLLFAGVEAPLPALEALSASCLAAGRRVGLDLEDRPYRPHLTLARVKGRRPADVRAAVEELRDYRGPEWLGSSVSLVRSHLGPDPRYETLNSWPLRT
jgi:2'-5' RNA ligase